MSSYKLLRVLKDLGISLEIIIYLIIGLSGGILAGMFGIGGGIVIVPALIFFLHFSPQVSNGTSLFALLLPVGILGALAYHRAKLIDLKAALWIDLGLFLGISGGAVTALSVSPNLLKMIYGIFLLFISYRFIQPMDLSRSRKNVSKTTSSNTMTQQSTLTSRSIWKQVTIGLFAGILAGLFGIGGGIVIVPALIVWLGYDQKTASGTSLAALLLPVGLPGVLIYFHAGQFDLQSAIYVASGLLIGALFGALFAIRMPSKIVNRLYGIFLLFVGVTFIVGAI
ncbi:MAG: sulfite exporter TauE/SafE family protein [Candidatus Marinimicrobia bacterium]|nr:sulfite exporter TauE/SafE family protein [Candidatus Neomarinimicrobiota bacterium]